MNKRITVLLLALLVIGLAAWHALKPDNQKTSSPASGQAPVITVTLVNAKRMDVPVRLNANGYVSSLNSVDVRPQVSNLVTKVHIKEGQFVKAGDLLFSLDDRADRVNLQRAEAQLARDQVSLAELERQLTRSRELLSKGFIAQSATDNVQAQVEAARATLQADRAAVAAAQVALGYDTIRASSSGRAGAIFVYPGSLVQPNATSAPLVTIAQLDPIAVTFTLPERELNGLLSAQKNGEVQVTAAVPDAKPQLEGKLAFIDNTVDPQNGTIKVKAIFPNAEQRLWPGQYVPVNTVVRELKDAVVIPQAAVITGIDTRSVYVTGADKTAQTRRIDVLYAFGSDAAVSGVQAGESVVVDGKQNLRPGSKIREAGAPVEGNKGKHKSAS